VAKERDWTKAFLTLDVGHEPGSHYRYAHVIYMLSAIMERVTGQSLVDFLTPAVFEYEAAGRRRDIRCG
jgi:CubicO group peptidase (beta-lactamase class C family)